MMYGFGSCALHKNKRIKIKITEVRIVPWTCGVTRLNIIRNIKESLGVTEIVG